MNYRVALSREAEKVLDRLDRPTEERLRARLRELEADPFDPRISKQLVNAAANDRPELEAGGSSWKWTQLPE